VIVNIEGEASKTFHGRVKEIKKCGPLPEASKGIDDVKTNIHHRRWSKRQGYLVAVAAASGISMGVILRHAFTENSRNCR